MVVQKKGNLAKQVSVIQNGPIQVCFTLHAHVYVRVLNVNKCTYHPQTRTGMFDTAMSINERSIIKTVLLGFFNETFFTKFKMNVQNIGEKID